MIVCVCNNVSDHEIRCAFAEGHDTLDALEFELGVGSSCGSCFATARAILRQEAACAAESGTPVHPLHFLSHADIAKAASPV